MTTSSPLTTVQAVMQWIGSTFGLNLPGPAQPSWSSWLSALWNLALKSPWGPPSPDTPPLTIPVNADWTFDNPMGGTITVTISDITLSSTSP